MWTFNRTSTGNSSDNSSWISTTKRREEEPNQNQPGSSYHMPVYARAIFGSFPSVQPNRLEHGEQCLVDQMEAMSLAKKVRVVPFDEFELVSNSAGSHVEYVNHEQSSEIMKQMRALRDDEQLCDVELIVDGTVIRAHRYILAAASPYFRAMFTNGMVEMTKMTIELQELPKESIQILIDYIYTDKIGITMANVQQLIFTASILQMDVIVGACQEFLSNKIGLYNCLELHEFAVTYNCTTLIAATDDFVADQFEYIRQQPLFKSVTVSHLKRLLGRSDLNVKEEQDVFETIISWIDVDPQERLPYLADLFEAIRLHLIGWNYLCQVVRQHKYVKENRECKDLISAAIIDVILPHQKTSHAPVEENISQYSASAMTESSILSLSSNDYHFSSNTSRYKARKSVAGIIFCAGGRGTAGSPFSSVEAYDWRTNHWFPIADMMSQRRHVGVVSASGCLYAIGGHDGVAHLATAEVFNPSTGSWRRISSMMTARRGIAVASMDSAIYAVGGLDDTTCYRTVERYDIESDEWKKVADMDIQRGGVGVAALGKYLFAIGGNDGTSSLDTCERFDPLVDKWKRIARMQNRRAGSGVCVLEGYLYAIGGFDDNAPLATCERYDMETDQWQTLANMSSPRGGVGVAAMGGKVYAIGGHDGSRYLNTVECYDPVQNVWREAADIQECRAGAGVAWANVRMHQLGRVVKCHSGCAPSSGSHCV